jgi:hypothetical protein
MSWTIVEGLKKSPANREASGALSGRVRGEQKEPPVPKFTAELKFGSLESGVPR